MPFGDQPRAIDALTYGLEVEKKRSQVLLGVTGSGKTFTIANVIQNIQRPTLIMAPNKTLAAQLYQEMKGFFPDNAVEYFVSYYDYYQPEAYIAKTDTYIGKESTINEQIDRMRHSATRSLLERRDVIIVASVSCIYGIGSPESYSEMTLIIKKGDFFKRDDLLKKLVELQYERNDIDFTRGKFRTKGDIVEIFPSHSEDFSWRISMFGDEIESISELDPLTGKSSKKLDMIKVFANSHYVTSGVTVKEMINKIGLELNNRITEFESENKLLEAQRIRERTNFDLEMLHTTGYCRGIENYSRYLTGRNPGEPPPTLFEYLPSDALLVIDESHVAIPQIGGMYEGDRVRKQTLSDYGFRLPSCKDNRPLKFDEWNGMRPQTIFVSATPGRWEMEEVSYEVVEQIIRPTGLVDPECIVVPTVNQIDDLLERINETIVKGYRILVTTLTKKMAESLTKFFTENGVKVQYIHSDVDTLERIDIIRSLRIGEFDVLVGINLLREGLDIPECGMVAILDADRQGFLRSKTSLIQTIGRAARNADGYVVMYADEITESMDYAIKETQRRRDKQKEYNRLNGITPETIRKSIHNTMQEKQEVCLKEDQEEYIPENTSKHIKSLEQKMKNAAKNMDFESAAKIRDEIRQFKKLTK